MNSNGEFVKTVADCVGRAGSLSCLTMLLLGTFGSVSAGAQTLGFVYVANEGTNNVSAYTIDGATGALTAAPGSPFPAGSAPISVAVDPTGKFAFAANCGAAYFCLGGGPGNVSAYTIDGTTGSLSAVPGSPFPAGSNPVTATVDPTSRFIYVVNFGSNNVSAYTIDGTTGSLSAVPGSPFPAGSAPISVTVDPTGRFTYAANCGSSFCPPFGPGNVSAYTIDGTTGALTAVVGSPFPAGSVTDSVAVDPTGQFAYAVNFVSNNVSAYTINGATGALTEIPSSPFPAGAYPRGITVTSGPTPPLPSASPPSTFPRK